jgi:hypothetical protein
LAIAAYACLPETGSDATYASLDEESGFASVMLSSWAFSTFRKAMQPTPESHGRHRFGFSEIHLNVLASSSHHRGG